MTFFGLKSKATKAAEVVDEKNLKADERLKKLQAQRERMRNELSDAMRTIIECKGQDGQRV